MSLLNKDSVETELVTLFQALFLALKSFYIRKTVQTKPLDSSILLKESLWFGVFWRAWYALRILSLCSNFLPFGGKEENLLPGNVKEKSGNKNCFGGVMRWLPESVDWHCRVYRSSWFALASLYVKTMKLWKKWNYHWIQSRNGALFLFVDLRIQSLHEKIRFIQYKTK